MLAEILHPQSTLPASQRICLYRPTLCLSCHAEQVVWVVSKQQVMHLQARSAAAGPALQLVSPTFALPCSVSNTGSEAPGGAAAAAGGVEHHQTIEW